MSGLTGSGGRPMMPAMVRIRRVEALPSRFRNESVYLGSHDVPDGSRDYFTRPQLRAVYSRYFETTFVKITTDDGATGWGECLAPVVPQVVATIVNDLLAENVVGMDALAHAAIRSRLYNLMRDRGYFGGFYVDAITAIDMALWDVRGRALGTSIASLLGGPYRDDVPAYVSAIGGVEDSEKERLVGEWRERGFRGFKHHGGYGKERDLHTMRAICRAAGSESIVGYDGHWNFTPYEAETMGRHLEEIGVSFFEAPCDPEDVNAHARIAGNLAIPIAIGESIRTRYEYLPWLEQRAADILQPDIGRSGISEAVALASMAEPFSVTIAPHLSVGLGPMVAASIHVAASIPNLYMLEYQPPTMSLANKLLENPIELVDGCYQIPDGDGLGIAISERRIRDLQA